MSFEFLRHQCLNYPQSASRVNCHIGYAQLAMNLPSVHVEETFPTLLDVLNDIPDMDFDRSLVWERKFIDRS